MPHPLVLGIFDTLPNAAHAARAIHALGIIAQDLSVVAKGESEEQELARSLDATPGAEIEESRVAARLGELGAYLVAAVAVGIPGIGPAVTAGPLSAEFSEVAGRMAGGVTGVLRQAGLSGPMAVHWEQRIQDGAILLAVHASPANAQAVQGAFEQSGAAAITIAQWS